MKVEMKALAAFLRRRGGMLGCDDFANVLTLTIIGLPPEVAVERSLDVSYPERLARNKDRR